MYPDGNVCLYVHKQLELFLSVYVDDVENVWKEAEHGTHVQKF